MTSSPPVMDNRELGLVDPLLPSVATRGRFSRADGVSIEFCTFRQEDAKHHALLLTGWDESFIKYGDVITELLAAGFNVYTMDWRSQGLSGRLVLDSQLTHVESFDDYVEDLKFFVEEVVRGPCGVEASELTCLAHSMGGFIALTSAAKGLEWFQRLVVCSPMIRMKAGMPHRLALWLAKAICGMGLGNRYAPGQSGIDPTRPITKKLTTDKTRLAAWAKIRRAYPIVAMGGMSGRWVLEAVRAQNWFESVFDQVTIPVLLLEAGMDTFVCTARPFRRLCQMTPNCRRLRYPMTYHEILFEKDWARSHAMQATIDFLKFGKGPAHSTTTVAPPDVGRSHVGGSLTRVWRHIYRSWAALERPVDDKSLGADAPRGGTVQHSVSDLLKGKGDRKSYTYVALVSVAAAAAVCAIGVAWPVGQSRRHART